MDPRPARRRRAPRSRRRGRRFDFAAATGALYHLTFDDFCDWYAEAIKPRLYDGDEDARATALAALERLLALLHPLMPHVTEEIWSHLPAPARAADRLAVARAGSPRHADAVGALDRVQEAAQTFRRSGVPGRARHGRRAAHLRGRRPARAPAGGRRRRGRAGAPAQGDRAGRGDARQRAVRRERSGRRRRRRSARSSSGTARELDAPRRRRPSHRRNVAWLAGALAVAARTASGSTACARCSPRWATRRPGCPPIHVVGTNGKSTTTRTIEALLLARAASASARTSRRTSALVGADPRRRGGGRPRGGARRRSRPAAERLEATQFEIAHRRGARRVPRGGTSRPRRSRRGSAAARRDERPRRTRVVVLTNVGLEHTDVLGSTREAIAAEKLAVIAAGLHGRPRRAGVGAARAGGGRGRRRRRRRRGSTALAVAAARRSSARRRRRPRAAGSRFPAGSSAGRGRSATARTIPTACGGSSSVSRPERLHALRVDPRRQGRRRDARGARRARATRSSRRRSSNPRALPAERPRRARAAPHFERVEAVDDPRRRARARPRLGEPVLVTGSLYLLADLEAARSRSDDARAARRARASRCRRARDRRNRVCRRVYPRQAASLMTRRRRQLLRLEHVGRRRATSRSSSSVVFWLATAYWVYKDARRRIEDPWLVGDRDAARADPAVPRPARLHALPAARVPRGRARARARDPRDGGAARRARPPLPGLPRRGRPVVPRLPGLHDAAQAGVRGVRRPARGDLAGLPVLRDARARPASARARTCSSRCACERARRGDSTPLRLPSAAVAVETTLVLVKPDGVRRGLCGEIVARFERRGYELRGARLLKLTKAARARALRGAPRQAVLRRPRRLHHLGPRARARRPRRGRDRRRPRDDGRDEPGRRRARHDPRRPRDARSPRTSCTAPTRARARRRELALFFPDGLL